MFSYEPSMSNPDRSEFDELQDNILRISKGLRRRMDHLEKSMTHVPSARQIATMIERSGTEVTAYSRPMVVQYYINGNASGDTGSDDANDDDDEDDDDEESESGSEGEGEKCKMHVAGGKLVRKRGGGANSGDHRRWDEGSAIDDGEESEDDEEEDVEASGEPNNAAQELIRHAQAGRMPDRVMQREVSTLFPTADEGRPSENDIAHGTKASTKSATKVERIGTAPTTVGNQAHPSTELQGLSQNQPNDQHSLSSLFSADGTIRQQDVFMHGALGPNAAQPPRNEDGDDLYGVTPPPRDQRRPVKGEGVKSKAPAKQSSSDSDELSEEGQDASVPAPFTVDGDEDVGKADHEERQEKTPPPKMIGGMLYQFTSTAIGSEVRGDVDPEKNIVTTGRVCPSGRTLRAPKEVKEGTGAATPAASAQQSPAKSTRSRQTTKPDTSAAAPTAFKKPAIPSPSLDKKTASRSTPPDDELPRQSFSSAYSGKTETAKRIERKKSESRAQDAIRAMRAQRLAAATKEAASGSQSTQPRAGTPRPDTPAAALQTSGFTSINERPGRSGGSVQHGNAAQQAPERAGSPSKRSREYYDVDDVDGEAEEKAKKKRSRKGR